MSAPYYQDDLVTLYHGDCREITEWLEADVLVTDPPYGIRLESARRLDANGRQVRGEQRYDRVKGDRDTAARDDALTLWGAERPALVFGRWDAPRPAGTHKRLIWDKGNSPGPGNLRLPWGQSDEEIYVLGRWPGRSGGPPRAGSIIRVRAYGAGALAKDRPDHPTPKPPGLFAHLGERCPPGVLADPFAGSGPLALAARQLGRRAILVELDERYCEVIASRLSVACELAGQRLGLVVRGEGTENGAGEHVAGGARVDHPVVVSARERDAGFLDEVRPDALVHEDSVARSHPATDAGAA